MGSIYLPGTYAIIGGLPLFGRVTGFLFAGCLLFGGAACFILPSLWMSRASRELRVALLEPYAATLNRLSGITLAAETTPGNDGVDYSQLSDRIAAVTALRALAASEQTAPSALWVGARTFAIFVIPIIISAVQTAAGIS